MRLPATAPRFESAFRRARYGPQGRVRKKREGSIRMGAAVEWTDGSMELASGCRDDGRWMDGVTRP
jgi:hypothetical protein